MSKIENMKGTTMIDEKRLIVTVEAWKNQCLILGQSTSSHVAFREKESCLQRAFAYQNVLDIIKGMQAGQVS
jgi:hypothetical protein